LLVVQGCGCAPDETIRWLVVSLLGVAGTAILAARWWVHRRRRSTEGSPPDAPPSPSDPRSRVERSAPVVAGLIIGGLALFVAVVPMSSDPSLLVLALGATIGTAGFGLASRRTRHDSTPGSR
jgi:peptidoglycan/LPS O-acetylase OafA/YrhL